MAGCTISRHVIRGLGRAASLALFSAALAQTPSFAMQTTPETNSLVPSFAPSSPDLGGDGGRTPGLADPVPVTPRSVRPAREVRGNPLWAIPLQSLNVTRERPILLPSRRAPIVAIAGPPLPEPVRAPSPVEPARPRLALVGAVVGEAEGIAVLVDQTTSGIVRLRTGENYSGWTLSSVKAREATLEKERDAILLSLPAPDGRETRDLDAPPRPTAPAATLPPVSPGTVVTPAVSAPLPAGLVVHPILPPQATQAATPTSASAPVVAPPVSPGTVVTPAVSAPLPDGLTVQPMLPPPPSPPAGSAPRERAPPPAVPPV